MAPMTIGASFESLKSDSVGSTSPRFVPRKPQDRFGFFPDFIRFRSSYNCNFLHADQIRITQIARTSVYLVNGAP